MWLARPLASAPSKAEFSSLLHLLCCCGVGLCRFCDDDPGLVFLQGVQPTVPLVSLKCCTGSQGHQHTYWQKAGNIEGMFHVHTMHNFNRNAKTLTKTVENRITYPCISERGFD